MNMLPVTKDSKWIASLDTLDEYNIIGHFRKVIAANKWDERDIIQATPDELIHSEIYYRSGVIIIDDKRDEKGALITKLNDKLYDRIMMGV